jgi:hypothetical protein
VRFHGDNEVIVWRLELAAKRQATIISSGNLTGGAERMSFVIYFAMLVVALVSVALGLDVVTAPPIKTASRPALVEPIRHQAAPVQPAVPAPPEAQQAVPQSAPRQTVSQSSESDSTEGQASAAAPACNVQACEAAYRSFTAADCTYQPYDGPRRLCTK